MSEMPHGPGRQGKRQGAGMLVRAHTPEEAVLQCLPSSALPESPCSSQSWTASQTVQQPSSPLALLRTVSERIHSLYFTGPRLQGWGKSSESLPRLNHLSPECQDCHSCSTGPFLETKQGHKTKVCAATSDLSGVHSRHRTDTWRGGIKASCTSLGGGLEALALVQSQLLDLFAK